MGTEKAILPLRMIIEKLIMKGKPIDIAFVDIEKCLKC